MGWEDIESTEYKGGPVIVMFKDLMQQKKENISYDSVSINLTPETRG